MTITLYHNPHCSKSRETLAIIRANGIEPEIINYLDQPPTREALLQLLALLRIPVTGLMRTGDALYAELGLDDPHCDDAQRLEALLAKPALFNRPVAVSALGARVCRPPETVREILPNKDEFNLPQAATMKST
jgi:arsenate reductase